MSKGAVPCGTCGAPVPFEHARCSKCGTPLKFGAPGELHTVPGMPLVRAPKRRRISSHDFVPATLRAEYEALARDRTQKQSALARALDTKAAWAAAIGAALAALPFAAATLFYMPDKSWAVILFFLDALLGALAGRIVLRMGGGAIKAVAVFVPNFVGIIAMKIWLGYPIAHNPAAFAVLICAGLLALSVSGFLGVALDESELAS